MKKFAPIALIIIASFSLFFLKQRPKVENRKEDVGEAATITEINSSGNPFLGRVDASVTLYYWFDFQCPFCKQFDEEVLPVLIDKYVVPGEIKVVFMNYQFLGPDSQTAGIIGQAVWETSPKNYLKWHQGVFQKQDNSNGGWGNQNDILKVVQSIPEISLGDVSQLVLKNESAYREKINRDKDEGAKVNIKTTPSVLIGRQVIRGVQPALVYTELIDSLINR